MFIDKAMEIMDDVAITAATNYLGNSIPLQDTGSSEREGSGEPMEFVILVTETFAGGTSVQPQIVTATDGDLTANLSVQSSPGSIVTAQLVEGKVLRMPLDIRTNDSDATHIGLRMVSAGTHTAGKISAWIQRAGEHQRNNQYYGV